MSNKYGLYLDDKKLAEITPKEANPNKESEGWSKLDVVKNETEKINRRTK